MKIVFDNSIHLGQFCISDEPSRIAAKNSQALISLKPDDRRIGIESFNENTYSDDLIWELAREPQDTFYRFMDLYHSITNVDRVPLMPEDARTALEIAELLDIGLSNALTCAIAIRYGADQVHSLYPELSTERVESYLAGFGIAIGLPDGKELAFAQPDLESRYQDALASFREHSIDLPARFHG